MKTAPSRSLLYFFIASLFSVLAQSFLLIPYEQGALLVGFPSVWVVSFAIFLLLLVYFNLGLVFYQHTARLRKIVTGFSVLALGGILFLYVRAEFYLEALPLFFSLLLPFFVSREKELPVDWLGHVTTIVNALVGLLLLFPQVFLPPNNYRFAFPLRFFFSVLFLITVFLKLTLDRKPDHRMSAYSNILLAFPWIGWALLFSLDASLPQLIPATLFVTALLSCGLLPFEKFRLPDNKILGYSVFPLLAILFAFLLIVFTVARQIIGVAAPVGNFLFFFSFILSALFVYFVMRLHYLINELTSHSLGENLKNEKGESFKKLVDLLFGPFQELQPLSEWQAKKIQRLSTQLLVERENTKRFGMLNQLRGELDEFHDDPVSAQLVVNTISNYFDAALVAILMNDLETQELALYSLGGKLKAYVPAGYRQSIEKGTLGRAARLKKVQVINDTSLDRHYFNLQGEKIESEVYVPLLKHGSLKAILMVASERKGAFSATDIRVLEAAAEELLRTWERSGHNRRMRALIQSSISLSTSFEPQSAVQEITKVARETLLARFVFVTLLDQEGTFTRVYTLGYAPKLAEHLSRDLQDNPLLKIALAEKEPLRIRDIRRYKKVPEIPLDHNILRGVMIVPIRLHGVSIGAIIAFGKDGAIFFSEKDESLANLLATQAATAVESSWLIQELRSNATTTNLLYALSIEVIQTNTIREAARLIAETAQRMTHSSSVGIILFSLDHRVETALELDAGGKLSMGKTIPLQFVEQTLASGEVITLSEEEHAMIYLPIQTSLRKYGVLRIDFAENDRQAAAQTQTLKTLANQAAMALERAMLLLDLRRKADELKEALDELGNAYDQTLVALMAALDARDRETEGHSIRVGKLACRIAVEFGLDTEQIDILRRGALLHDIGKIGVSDIILHKPGPLTDDEWRIMRQHPEIGARIVKSIPFLAETMPIIRHHHERWNGSGYPFGLAEDKIPIMARIFAIADVFDALTSVRPYRQTVSHEEAFEYLRENAGILFDPVLVDIFESLLLSGAVGDLVNNE